MLVEDTCENFIRVERRTRNFRCRTKFFNPRVEAAPGVTDGTGKLYLGITKRRVTRLDTRHAIRELFLSRPRMRGGGLLPRTHHARPGSAHDGERVAAPEDPRKAPDHSQDARSHGTRRRCALDPHAARDSDAVRDAEKTSPPTLVLTARPISNQQQPRRTLSRRPRRLLSRRSRRRSRYVTPSSHQSDPRRARSILAPRHASQLPFACRVFGAAVRRRPRGARSRWKFRASRRTPRPSIRT